MQSPRRHPPLAAIILAIAAALPGLQACTAVAAPVPSQRGEEATDPPGRVGRISELTARLGSTTRKRANGPPPSATAR